MDARRFWFRYHRLFADLLQLELRRTAPDEIPALHRAAAGWYAGHGYPIEAVRHAQAAQDWGLAARLLSDHFLGLVLDGRGDTAHELLAGFPADVVTADAELTALMAGDELRRRSLEAAERYLTRATRGAASVPADRRGRFQVELAIQRLAIAQGRGDLPTVVEEAQRLLAPAGAKDPAHAGHGEDLHALALVSLGAAETWARRVGEAERHLEQGAALARRIGRPWLEVSGLAHGAMAASFRSFGPTVELSTRAIELARRHGWAEEPVAGVAYLALGTARVWQGRLEEADLLLDHARRALRAEAEPAVGVMLHQGRGVLELARGHDAEALAAFRAVGQLAGLLVAAHPRATRVYAFLVPTLVRLGESGRAEQIVAELDKQQRERGEMRIAVAALRLAQNQPQAATAALAPVLDGFVPVRPLHIWMVQAFLLEAIARDALGDPGAAGRALERALDLAEPDGAVFAFLLNPAPELLKRHARHRTAHAALISDILNLLAGKNQAPPPGSEGGWEVGEACVSRLPTARPACCATCRPTCPHRRSPPNCPCR
jgi:LuxR family maltose regulon positive regulatory protein